MTDWRFGVAFLLYSLAVGALFGIGGAERRHGSSRKATLAYVFGGLGLVGMVLLFSVFTGAPYRG